MFVNLAHAQTEAIPAGLAGSVASLAPFILIFVVMYFLIIRPQRQKIKLHQEMLTSLKRGDSVVTGGGFIGKITKVLEESNEVQVELADGIRVRVLRATIHDLYKKGQEGERNKEKEISKE